MLCNPQCKKHIHPQNNWKTKQTTCIIPTGGGREDPNTKGVISGVQRDGCERIPGNRMLLERDLCQEYCEYDF